MIIRVVSPLLFLVLVLSGGLPPVTSVAQFATNTPLAAGTALPFPTQSAASAATAPTPRGTPTLAVEAFVDQYVLARPIARREGLQDFATRVYPYGGTQFGRFQVHLGVDFVNPRFTQVLAAADGVVVYAGGDRDLVFGPHAEYYGNLVVLAHALRSADGLPVFTLYGHLEQVSVAQGDAVTVGQAIGTVGATGIALGPHLHFEVRVGDPLDYRSTRNPDLWIRPYPGFGTLAGRVTTREADWRAIVVLIRANGRTREAYTYGSERVNSDPSWQENFTYGDLPAGDYEVLVSDHGRVLFRQMITIADGRTTFVDIPLDK